MTHPSFHGIVFGPFKSKVFGTCLGVNVAPGVRQDCESDCIYCRYGCEDTVPVITKINKLPSAGVIITSAARKIIELSKAGEKLGSILVTGEGEPTSHPKLREITENLKDLRAKWFPKAALVLQSETVGFSSSEALRIANLYDRTVVRFDWGTAKAFSSATGAPTSQLRVLQEQLTSLERLVVLTTFAKSDKLDNSSDAEVRNWVKRIGEIQPSEVHIKTIDAARNKAKQRPVPATRLEKIAAQLTETTELPVSILAEEAQAV